MEEAPLGRPPRNTASAFADWVFSVTTTSYPRYGGSTPVHALQDLGRAAHQWIEAAKRSISQMPISQGLSSKWELVYFDAHDGTNGQVLFASRLVVDGEPLHCKPDVVFRDSQTGSVVVVDRKLTGRAEEDIPTNDWPNHRSQLWAYGWIDAWADAPEVILVLNYFRRNLEKIGHGSVWQSRTQPFVEHKTRRAWRRSNLSLHQDCLSLFRRYGGSFFPAWANSSVSSGG